MIPLPSPSPSPTRSNSMSENPLQNLSQAIESICNGIIRPCLFSFTGQPHQPSKATGEPLFSFGLSTTKVKASSSRDTKSVQPKEVLNKVKPAGPVIKEELGRVTWTFLHTLAAQYPDNPTRQQKKDVKELMAILSRMYPCKECADHFKEVLRSNPVQASSHAEFSQWLCQVHNVVNRSLGKPVFPCERVDARWGKLECEQRECDLLGTTTDFGHS